MEIDFNKCKAWLPGHSRCHYCRVLMWAHEPRSIRSDAADRIRHVLRRTRPNSLDQEKRQAIASKSSRHGTDCDRDTVLLRGPRTGARARFATPDRDPVSRRN